MMLNKAIGQFLLRFYKSEPVDREYSGWGKVEKIFVTGAVDELWTESAWEEWKQKLLDDGKKVDFLIYHPLQKEAFVQKNGLSYFGKKAINILEQPKSQYLKSQKQKAVYDVIFCMNEVPSLTLQYICAQTRARFRVGCYDDPFSAYDLMLLRPKSMDSLVFSREMLRYLRQINAN
jgi:hypothetical protein